MYSVLKNDPEHRHISFSFLACLYSSNSPCMLILSEGNLYFQFSPGTESSRVGVRMNSTQMPKKDLEKAFIGITFH